MHPNCFIQRYSRPWIWVPGLLHTSICLNTSVELLISIVPDNLKTGVTKSCYYEPEIHPTYLEMARHYQMAIIPARVRKPKDKSLAEYSVQLVERWIIAKHRDDTYFSFYELNRMVRRELDLANLKPFQKMDGRPSECF